APPKELPAGPKEVERGLTKALVELAPKELLERRLVAGDLVVGEVGEHSHAVGAQHLVLDDEPRELLADRRTGAAKCAAGFGEERSATRAARGMGRCCTPA